MNVTFIFEAVFGKGDSTDWEADVEITEEEYHRIEEACLSGEEFRDCEEVEDIYNRLVEIASEGMDEDAYAIVNYPKGMEESLWEEDYEEDDEDE